MCKNYTMLWLMLGLGIKLQIVASLSISEAIVLGSAPFIFLKNYRQMRRDGVMTLFLLSLLVIVGCAVSCIANHTELLYVVRGMATTCLISCSIIFSHWIIRKDPSGFKWMLVGSAFSSVMSTFFFQNAVELTQTGGDVDLIMSGPLFWIQRLGAFVTLPTRGWYIHMPIIVNIAAPLSMGIFSILISQSGRAAALTAIAFVAIALIGGKSRRTMMRMARYFWLICGIGVVGMILSYTAYKTAAMRGWLGEESRMKYEVQTDGGSGGVGRLLLGGRGDSFIGLLACRDRPIVGWGPWAIDSNGYRDEFMMKYGTMEDVLKFYEVQQRQLARGIAAPVRLISAHSHITEFWLWYGIFGLIFWIYVMVVLLRYLHQDCFAVPQWFAWLACSVPGMFWHIFFSPFAARIETSMFVVACLMARGVRKGTFKLPFKMSQEIEKTEKR